MSTVDSFNYGNVILGANGGFVNLDNGIYLNYGNNMTTSSMPFGISGPNSNYPYNNSN